MAGPEPAPLHLTGNQRFSLKKRQRAVGVRPTAERSCLFMLTFNNTRQPVFHADRRWRVCSCMACGMPGHTGGGESLLPSASVREEPGLFRGHVPPRSGLMCQTIAQVRSHSQWQGWQRWERGGGGLCPATVLPLHTFVSGVALRTRQQAVFTRVSSKDPIRMQGQTLARSIPSLLWRCARAATTTGIGGR
jgi:hypothetical protein